MSQKKNLLRGENKFQKRLEVVRIAQNQGPQQALLKTGEKLRTIHSWVKRFENLGVDGLRDKSRAPKRVANKKDTDGILTKKLVELHKNEPGLTRGQILGKLFIEPSESIPTLSWIDRTRQRLSLTHKRKERKNEHKLRYERPVPGYLQIDTKVIPKAGEPGEHLYQFTAIDECTRVRFLASSLTKGAKAAALFLQEAIKFFEKLDVKILQAQTDRGTEFTLPQTEATLAAYARGETEDSLFTQECKKNGIRHRLIKPRSPELNGKVERSHRIDEERFYSRFEFTNTHDHDHALKHVWMPEYNELRPHGAIGYKTPMEYLKQKVREIQKEELLNKIDTSPEEKKAA